MPKNIHYLAQRETKMSRRIKAFMDPWIHEINLGWHAKMSRRKSVLMFPGEKPPHLLYVASKNHPCSNYNNAPCDVGRWDCRRKDYQRWSILHIYTQTSAPPSPTHTHKHSNIDDTTHNCHSKLVPTLLITLYTSVPDTSKLIKLTITLGHLLPPPHTHRHLPPPSP